MRYIQTSNKHIQFIEADGSDNIIASKGFAFNELYYQIANGKVSFYLNDSETPYRNDVWSIGLPATINGEEYNDDTIAEALAALFASDGGGGGDLSDYYTKEQTDYLLLQKSDLDDTYTIEEVDDLLDDKLDVSAYTPCDLSEYYTSAQTEARLADKLDVSAYTPTDLSEYWTSAQTSAAINAATSGLSDTYATKQELQDDEQIWATALNGLESRKADKTGIKTINGQSLIGEGDITIGTGGTIVIDDHLDSGSSDAVANSAITIALDALEDGLATHTANTDVHVTAADKTNWNGKADQSNTYTKSEVDAMIASGGDLSNYYTKAEDDVLLAGKADYSGLTAHTSDTTIHVTAADKTNWNGKADESDLQTLSGTVTTIQQTLVQVWCGTEIQYNQIQQKDPNTIYLIQDA